MAKKLLVAAFSLAFLGLGALGNQLLADRSPKPEYVNDEGIVEVDKVPEFITALGEGGVPVGFVHKGDLYDPNLNVDEPPVYRLKSRASAIVGKLTSDGFVPSP